MQTLSLRIKSYRSWRINDRAPTEAIDRIHRLELYDQLKQEGCSEALRLKSIGWSRATYYRWSARYNQLGWEGLVEQSRRPYNRRQSQWTKQQEQIVLHIRQRYRCWGKRKIWKIMVRDHQQTISESSVGRIISKLIKNGKILPVSFYYGGRMKPKKKRQFSYHARRWQYGMKAKKVGQMIQIDHMSISFTEGFNVKEFKATCPITGMTFLRCYSTATSHNAKRFLMYLKQQAPFTIESIQVDGGSEFMAEFEEYCRELGIKLWVLPPKRPDLNGCVERANGTTRYEFYPFYEGSLSVRLMNQALDDYESYYNTYRPHEKVGLDTPMEYYLKITQAA